MDLKTSKHSLTFILSGIMMLILILDAQLVVTGAVSGIELCLWTVIPSLFPFFVISSLINGSIGGRHMRILRFLERLYCVPAGSAHIVAIGMLGGYPIGAQGIADAYKKGILTKQSAARMLMFCNNAGPAFIFGMVAQQFGSVTIGWYLWLITILSSVFVAASIPAAGVAEIHSRSETTIGITEAITKSVKAMANVCAWVVLFRVILTLLQKRVLHNSSHFLQTVLFGFLELSNGVVETSSITDPLVRFVLCTVFLNAGGLCVAMQTYSVTKALGLRTYLLGKALQTLYSILLSLMVIPVLFQRGSLLISLTSALICAVLLLSAQFFKKSIAISRKILYYIEN